MLALKSTRRVIIGKNFRSDLNGVCMEYPDEDFIWRGQAW